MKISVIIPVYNGEKWVTQCIENVLCQSYKDLEVIVVDDGSTDATAEIASRYPVKLIRQANKGLSGARNTGIDASTGDYIHFMDVDDCINLHYYERMAEAAEDADIVCGGVVNMNHSYKTILFPDRLLLTTPEDKFYVTNVGYNAYVWRYIIKRSFLVEHKLRFEEGRLFEDVLFSLDAFIKANRIVTVPCAVYYYMKREGSIMNSNGDKARYRKEQSKKAKAYRRDFCKKFGLNISIPIQKVEYRVFKIPVIQKTVFNSGKTHWYLFGLCVVQKKQLF